MQQRTQPWTNSCHYIHITITILHRYHACVYTVYTGATLHKISLYTEVNRRSASRSQFTHCNIPQNGRPSRLLQSLLPRLHPRNHASSETEAADSLLSGKHQPLLPCPRAPGSGTRRPAARRLPCVLFETPGCRGAEGRGDEALRAEIRNEKAKSTCELGPLPRRSSKLAFFNSGHSAFASSRQAAAGTSSQRHMLSS